MSLTTLIDKFKSKIELIEQSINKASEQLKHWTDNHHGLVGMLQGTKEALCDAEKIYNELNGQPLINKEIFDTVESEVMPATESNLAPSEEH